MGLAGGVERRLVDVAHGVVEVHVAGGPAGAATLCCSHPVDDFGEATARVLSELVGARVVCVNPRGVGASSPGAPNSLEAMVDDVEGVRSELGIERWMFWGLSGGGWLAQLYARKYPSALTGLVLESICACFRARVQDPRCEMSPENPKWRKRLEKRGIVSGAEVGSPLKWRSYDDVGDVLVCGDRALLVIPTGYPASERMKEAQETFLSFDSRDWLGELSAPALTLGAENDPVVPASHLRALHEGLTESELVVVPGDAHIPSLGGSVRALDALKAFIAERSGASESDSSAT